MKYLIQERFRGGKHYVWCSEYFDPSKHGSYGSAYGIPPSSSPANLYRRYKEDFEGGDTHSDMIKSQKAKLKARAVEWLAEGKISQESLEEIIYMVDKGRREDWRPLVYIIPRQLVSARLQIVSADQRSGVGMEYIVEDLTSDEFDLMEF